MYLRDHNLLPHIKTDEDRCHDVSVFLQITIVNDCDLRIYSEKTFNV